MNDTPYIATRAVLLKRRGLVFVDPPAGSFPERYVQAVEIELAELGYVPTTRLSARLGGLPIGELEALKTWTCGVLAAHLGADQKHRPLFRKFPDDVPDDTYKLWVMKVLSHFLQGEDQPCLFCSRVGTTHVLSPCRHVVCDHCTDGSNYSACPVCERQVDPSSPFFVWDTPLPEGNRGAKKKTEQFRLLDLGEDAESAARELFQSFCERQQALSPNDQEDFLDVIVDFKEDVLAWLPAVIPLRENVATIFGTLFRSHDPREVLPVAQEHMKTATDVLRFLAVYSGEEASLQGQTIYREVAARRALFVATRVNRFKMARLPRSLRRALLALLDAMPANSLTEDMLRHRSYWVWAGEFLHPHEYARRYPNAARAFAVVRAKGPDGTPAPAFQSYAGRLEAAIGSGDAEAMTQLLRGRPGELARRLDHALRTVAGDAPAEARLLKAFADSVERCSTPVLLTLANHLPARCEKAGVRIFWPKGKVSLGVSSPDERPVLDEAVITPAVEAVNDELLRRFAEKPAFGDCIVDVGLKDILVPFNERTASPSAVNLPRGSRIPVPPGPVARLFLHWCEPEKNGETTDLDLSVGFYDTDWNYVGVCSYYELKFTHGKTEIATSAGDLQSARFPEGASEFIDLHRQRALDHGVRYAVMVVNSYAGMPFGLLERGFAGLMLREDTGGKHFDPQTVELKFALQGENGIYLPFVFDLEDNLLHWLDTYSKGNFAFNNVESSNAAITRICPEMMEYFSSGVRMSMYELALLHAAARGRRVFLRGAETLSPRGDSRGETLCFTRGGAEDALAFHGRLIAGAGGVATAELPASEGDDGDPLFAALYRGDLTLAEENAAVSYVLFPDKVRSTIAAADLIS